jgi:transposase
MRSARLWKKLVGVEDVVVEGVSWEEIADDVEIVVELRVRRGRRRCGRCKRRSAGYDAGRGRRRWRGLDLGTCKVFIESEAPRVTCREHGVVVAFVPWARHDSEFTSDFEDQVAWMATQMSKSAIEQVLRIAWRTVGSIVSRVCDTAMSKADRLDGLKRIGIDEISHRKGQKYLTIVIDHDSNRLVWGAAGRESSTLEAFFDLLGEQRSSQLEFVSADGAPYIEKVVRQRCPNAVFCLDAFHVVMWAGEALDEVRRDVWNEARRAGMAAEAKELKHSRYALWKNPENLTARQKLKLSHIAKTNGPLYRAYLLKEQLRLLLKQPTEAGMSLLKKWLAWASRSRLESFVDLARKLRRRLPQIQILLEHRLSNARTESMNTRIRLIIRRAFGFHCPTALLALAMLTLGGLCPSLPGRRIHPLL